MKRKTVSLSDEAAAWCKANRWYNASQALELAIRDQMRGRTAHQTETRGRGA